MTQQDLKREAVPPAPRPGPPPRRRGGSGFGTLFLLALLAALAFLAFSDEGLREEATGFFSPEPGVAVFPLPAEYAGSFTDDWGAPREQGSHEGTDVYAPEGTPVFSITSGTVTDAFGSGDDGWNTLGGYTVMVRADRDAGPVRRGDRLYYAHLAEPTPLSPGERVEAGDRIGTVGRTAGEVPGTVADFPPHLHLGWYGGFGGFLGAEREAGYETSPSSGAINPYRLLLHTLERRGG